jgi:tetratricopeptide (TPR) repeat protein
MVRSKLGKIIAYLIAVILLIAALILGVYYILEQNTAKKEVSFEQEKSQAISLFEDQKLSEAQEVFEKLTVEKSNDNEIKIFLATIYLLQIPDIEEEKREEYKLLADQIARKVIDSDPSNFNAYRILGNIYELDSKIDDALNMYNKAISLNPLDELSLISRGDIYAVSGKFDLAVEDYKRALEINVESFNALIGVTSVYVATGRAKDINIEDLYERIIEISKSDQQLSIAYLAIGSWNLTNGKKEEALLNYEKSLEIGIDKISALHGSTFVNLSFADQAFKKENQEDFKKYLNQALEETNQILLINKNFSRAYLSLVMIYEGLGDTENVRKACKDGLVAVDKDETLDVNARKNFKENFNSILNTYEKE